jgi:hypothetical protein
MEAYVESDGSPKAMAEEDLCRAVGEDLSKHYPGHPWMVGACLQGGTIAIRLGYDLPQKLAAMGYLLHISTLVGPGGHQAVMRAGGEWLERLRLSRAEARDETGFRAKENGLNVDAIVTKSRH